ncbi:hypothetical protein BCh11DRAFT_07351 [Burkholderia sp. Ch1-1]|uniref:Uncharacterized protein n=1 Tax=Caballeronia udeis TaxID=1232866 RepID=A0A158JL89_9BURK|nr:hypothetical protein BCh11DRAFT_07351 [Burkholderia sp. Ch1-1]SAL69646.1 hypothetical protein AWB69_08241 [Caballeronia udeis]
MGALKKRTFAYPKTERPLRGAGVTRVFASLQ